MDTKLESDCGKYRGFHIQLNRATPSDCDLLQSIECKYAVLSHQASHNFYFDVLGYFYFKAQRSVSSLQKALPKDSILTVGHKLPWYCILELQELPLFLWLNGFIYHEKTINGPRTNSAL
jgi:hypothetical protein